MTTATMPQGRIPLAFVVIDGKRIPAIIDLEWARYLDALNQNLVASGASANDVTAINVFAHRPATFTAEQALEGNGDRVMESSAFAQRRPTHQAAFALESNSNAILAGQIFGA